MATKTTRKTEVFFTPKQVEAVNEKLRAAIRATTALIDKKNLNKGQASALKRYRKMLQDANNFFGWSVKTLALDRPSKKRQIR